ncbi:leucine-rich repeat-containing protein 4B-like [Anopheles maculipalpis]|uniref:leucine-rich repeat-containing protein 4B-like n=1 Tax=Anopheles maculipalpis TaxID=1496333 RepID=UPI0021599ADC|nr:leucine-rich repeat-containing protein 4B-like [Anopheles maculipalpis]
MRRYVSLLALITLWSLVSAYVYRCEPGTDPTVCNIWNMEYDAEIVAKHPDRLPSVNYTSTVSTVQLLFERYYYNGHNQLERYDLTLHGTVLRNPSVVQIRDYRLRRIAIPSNLIVGDFTDNVISVIDTDPTETYKVRYLDLSHNSLRDVENLTVLVQLETLNLEGNRIIALEANMFTRMINLTHLYLGDNNFHTFDFHTLPKGLNVLWLKRNELRELSLTSVLLPRLRELNLETNTLSSLDMAALFTAFPALEVVPIAYNTFAKQEASRIVAELKRRSVAYYIGMERSGSVDCDYDEYRVEDVCFAGSGMAVWSVWKAIVLLVIAVLVVGVFVLSVRWVWQQMAY